MADVNDDAVERNDSEVSAKEDSAPVSAAPAASAPAPTSDVETKSINSRLDGLEDMITRVMGQIEKITDAQSVLVESGAIIDTSDDLSDNDGIDNFNNPNFSTLDMCITD